MMKRLLLLAVAIGALGACAPAPMTQDTAADEAKLQADALAWFEHYNAGEYARADVDLIVKHVKTLNGEPILAIKDKLTSLKPVVLGQLLDLRHVAGGLLLGSWERFLFEPARGSDERRHGQLCGVPGGAG